MKVRLLFGLAVMCGTMTSALLLLIANQPPPLQYSFGQDPAPETAGGQVISADASPTPVSSSLMVLGAPRQPSLAIDTSISPIGNTSSFSSSDGSDGLVDLNIEHLYYGDLGLSPAESQAVYALRCTPAEPPLKPYPMPLEGCGSDAGGIIVLDQLVDAGVMSEQEVIDRLVGRVVQGWR